MSGLSTSKGFVLWVRALPASQIGSLSIAAEQMYRLNVLARSQGRHPITDQIYALKNELIKYLYQSGFSTEVKLHLQKRMCNRCDGTGEYWTGVECYKCDGTGVFAVTRLYAFRFCIDGHSFAWHQLEKFIDYPVTLTPDTVPESMPELRKEENTLSLEDAWLGCCIVWWSLLFHGVITDLLLFARWRSSLRRLFHVGWMQAGWQKIRQMFQRATVHTETVRIINAGEIEYEDENPF